MLFLGTRYVQEETCFLLQNGRRLGGSESARTEHPNREVVSSRPCVRARSVIHVESGMKWTSAPLSFHLWSREPTSGLLSSS